MSHWPKHKSSSGVLAALGMILGWSFSWLRAWLQKEHDRTQHLLPNPSMVIPGHENLLSDRSRTWQFFWNRSRTLCPFPLELHTLVQEVMHSLSTLAEPYLPVPQAVIACLHSKPKLTDPNCACGTAGLPEELNSILHCSTSHLTNCRDLWPHGTNLDFFFNSVLCISALPLHQFTLCLLFIFPNLWKLINAFWL